MAQPLGKKYNSMLYVDRDGVTKNVLAESGVTDLTMLEFSRGPKSFIAPITTGGVNPSDGPQWDDWKEYWLKRGMGLSLINRVKETYLNGRDIYSRTNGSIVTISDDPQLIAGLGNDGLREIEQTRALVKAAHDAGIAAVQAAGLSTSYTPFGGEISRDTPSGGAISKYDLAARDHMRGALGNFTLFTTGNGIQTPIAPSLIFAYVPNKTVYYTPWGISIRPRIIPGACVVILGTPAMDPHAVLKSTYKLLPEPVIYGLPIEGMMFPGVQSFPYGHSGVALSSYYLGSTKSAYTAAGGAATLGGALQQELSQYQSQPELLRMMMGRNVGDFTPSPLPVTPLRNIGKAFVSPQIGRTFAKGMLGIARNFVVGGFNVGYVTLTASSLHLATSTHEIANAMLEVYTDPDSLRRAAEVKMKPANVVSYCATNVDRIHPFSETWLYSQMVKGKLNLDVEQFTDGITWSKAIKNAEENPNPGEFVYFSESTFTEAVYGGDDMEFVNDGEFLMKYSEVAGEYGAPYFTCNEVRISENQARYAAYNYSSSWKTWTSVGGKITDLTTAMYHLFRDTEDDEVGDEGDGVLDPTEEYNTIQGVLAGLEDSGSGTDRGITRQDLAPSKFLKEGVPWPDGLTSDDISRMQLVYKGSQSKSVESIMGTIIMLASDPYRVARLIGAENG